jgi:small subunit ribosomal protein S16
MLRIRLRRVGRKHDPSYRIVIVESARSAVAGKYLESLGNYDARTDAIVIDGERVLYWMSHGAQASDTVYNLLVKEGIVKGAKRNVLPKKKPLIKEGKTGETNQEQLQNTPEEKKEEEAVVATPV